MTKRLLRATGVLAALYALVLLWFYAKQNTYVFHAERGKLLPAPAHLHLDSHQVTLRTADGVLLVARVIPPPPGMPADQAGWILYFHGAGGNIGWPAYNEAWARFRELGLGVLAIDYRGFGESGGTPSETGLYRDADAAYATLTETLHVPASHIVIYGYSLGSAVAIELATRVPAAGLIVEGAFLSVPARAAELYPFLPVSLLARNRFASVDKVASITMPKQFIHARADTIIPIAHGQRLFALAAPPKVFQDVAGNHTDAFQVDPGFFTAVARFITSVGLPTLRTPVR